MASRGVPVRASYAKIACCGLISAGSAGSAARASIDVVFLAESPSAVVGAPVHVRVYAVADDGGPQFLSAAQVVFVWDPAHLHLTGLSSAGAVPLALSVFPSNDTTGHNETVPPQDGDGTYLAWAPLGMPVLALPEGTLLTTFLFEALSPTFSTPVTPIPAEGQTKVLSGLVPGLVVTGQLVGASVQVVCAGGPADLDCDGAVDAADLAILLGAWGSPGKADLDGSGTVGGADLAFLLGAWT